MSSQGGGAESLAPPAAQLVTAGVGGSDRRPDEDEGGRCLPLPRCEPVRQRFSARSARINLEMNMPQIPTHSRHPGPAPPRPRWPGPPGRIRLGPGSTVIRAGPTALALSIAAWRRPPPNYGEGTPRHATACHAAPRMLMVVMTVVVLVMALQLGSSSSSFVFGFPRAARHDNMGIPAPGLAARESAP